MPQRTEKQAILFADISGSTRLYDEFGDSRASEMVASCLKAMTDTLAAHGGILIKTIGDEVMCTFPSAENALRAACGMQVAVESGRHGSDVPMYVRIGFHYGQLIRTQNDVYGDAVNTAARVTEVARARQIVATQAAVDALPLELRDKAVPVRRMSVKGKQQEFDIFQIRWQDDDSDPTRVGVLGYSRTHADRAELVLRFRQQEYHVGPHSPGAMLGRGDACQIMVKDDFASRQHARVDYRLGKFILSDQSINGTFVRFGDGETAHIVGEDMLLRGTGSISLGRAFAEQAVQIIEFAVEREKPPG
jgi:adenylate cyclase